VSVPTVTGIHPNDRLWLYLREPAPHHQGTGWTWGGERLGLGEEWVHPARRLLVLVSAQDVGDELWLHLSMSKSVIAKRGRKAVAKRVLPSWRDMAFARESFFRPGSVVLQIPPPEAEHVSIDEVLHLWERLEPDQRLVPDLRRPLEPGSEVLGI